MTHGFGIVGCGVVASMHADAIGALPGAHLVAVTDADEGRAKGFASERGADWEPDLPSLLRRGDLDVVCLCVPSGLHAEVGCAAAAAGKHVVVEKPIDISLAAADRLIAAAQDAGVALTVVSQHRFDPGPRRLRALLDEGRLGTPVLGDAIMKWYRSQAYYDSGGWRGTWELDGGGALMNQGIHSVDLLCWLMGPVVEVTAICATRSHEIAVEDLAVAMVRYGSGAVGTIQATTAAYPGFAERIEVSGTLGTAVVEGAEMTVCELLEERGEAGSYGAQVRAGRRGESAPSGGASSPAAVGARGHAAQLADFLQAIDSGREPSVTGSDGRAALEVVLAVYESASSGTTVRLPLGLR